MYKVFLIIIVLSIKIFSQSSGSWTQLNPSTKPSARAYSVMSRISDTEVLLFGGSYNGNIITETWKFNNSSESWTQLNPPTKPSAGLNSVMSRISDTEVLLFGGDNNDTKVYCEYHYSDLTDEIKDNTRTDIFIESETDKIVIEVKRNSNWKVDLEKLNKLKRLNEVLSCFLVIVTQEEMINELVTTRKDGDYQISKEKKVYNDVSFVGRGLFKSYRSFTNKKFVFIYILEVL